MGACEGGVMVMKGEGVSEGGDQIKGSNTGSGARMIRIEFDKI
jgi:hypothetical protein